jgi:hypothetical protein
MHLHRLGLRTLCVASKNVFKSFELRDHLMPTHVASDGVIWQRPSNGSLLCHSISHHLSPLLLPAFPLPEAPRPSLSYTSSSHNPLILPRIVASSRLRPGYRPQESSHSSRFLTPQASRHFTSFKAVKSSKPFLQYPSNNLKSRLLSSTNHLHRRSRRSSIIRLVKMINGPGGQVPFILRHSPCEAERHRYRACAWRDVWKCFTHEKSCVFFISFAHCLLSLSPVGSP